MNLIPSIENTFNWNNKNFNWNFFQVSYLNQWKSNNEI